MSGTLQTLGSTHLPQRSPFHVTGSKLGGFPLPLTVAVITWEVEGSKWNRVGPTDAVQLEASVGPTRGEVAGREHWLFSITSPWRGKALTQSIIVHSI